MASIFKLLSFIFFLALLFAGNDASNCVSVIQSKTGNWAHGMNERKVMIINRCACAVSEVKLDCTGFQTFKTEDPSILNKISDNVCLLKNGSPISTDEHVDFLYAWDPPFPFQPISFKQSCN